MNISKERYQLVPPSKMSFTGNSYNSAISYIDDAPNYNSGNDLLMHQEYESPEYGYHEAFQSAYLKCSQPIYLSELPEEELNHDNVHCCHEQSAQYWNYSDSLSDNGNDGQEYYNKPYGENMASLCDIEVQKNNDANVYYERPNPPYFAYLEPIPDNEVPIYNEIPMSTQDNDVPKYNNPMTLTIDGEFEPCEPEPGMIYDCFKKQINRKNNDSMTEFCIAMAIKNNPHKNIVTIYDCRHEEDYALITMEYLDQNRDIDESIIDDVHEALVHLHKQGVVYCDLHLGNVGWSHRDNCWKLYDFNCSGMLFSENQWMFEPFYGGRLREYIEAVGNGARPNHANLLDIDDYVEDLFKQEVMNYIEDQRCV